MVYSTADRLEGAPFVEANSFAGDTVDLIDAAEAVEVLSVDLVKIGGWIVTISSTGATLEAMLKFFGVGPTEVDEVLPIMGRLDRLDNRDEVNRPLLLLPKLVGAFDDDVSNASGTGLLLGGFDFRELEDKEGELVLEFLIGGIGLREFLRGGSGPSPTPVPAGLDLSGTSRSSKSNSSKSYTFSSSASTWNCGFCGRGDTIAGVFDDDEPAFTALPRDCCCRSGSTNSGCG